jgi:spore germination protein PE
MKRISSVGQINVNNISQASILQIGDNEFIKPTGKVLAVQREIADFQGNEGNFNDYSIFSRIIPIPEVYEEVHMFVDNVCNKIEVGRIRVLAVSAASVMQVGSNSRIKSESRILNIRHFNKSRKS